MANRLQTPAKDSFGRAEINWPSNLMRVVLLDIAAYSYSQSHQFLDSIPVAARIATSGDLTGKTVSGGVFYADNVTFAGFTGPSVEAAMIYAVGAADADSRLVFFIDTATSLPFTPDGRPVELRWSVNGIWSFADAA